MISILKEHDFKFSSLASMLLFFLGRLLKTLIHDELATPIYGQIRIYDDILAVPYWNKNCFKLFRLL